MFNLVLSTVLVVSGTWCLRKRLKTRLEPEHLPQPAICERLKGNSEPAESTIADSEVGHAAVDVKNVEVVEIPVTLPSAFDPPIRLSDIRIVSETDIPYKFIDLVKIPAKGDTEHLQVTKTTTKSWSVQGEIVITGCEDRVKIIFHSQGGRNRGFTNIQIGWDSKDLGEVDFRFEFETEQPPTLRFVANLGARRDSFVEEMNTKDRVPNSKPAEDDIDQISSRLYEVGTSYFKAFKRTGDLAALDQAIEQLQLSAGLTPEGHPRLPLLLQTLGLSYSKRFLHSDDLNDPTRSHSNNRQSAVEITPAGHVYLFKQFSSRGASHSESNSLKGANNVDDLALAISTLRNAVDNAPTGHPELPAILGNLANQCFVRYEFTDDPEDIQSAVANYQEALDITPADHPDFSNLLRSLGTAYFRRFGLTNSIQDLGSAISSQQRAVDDTPDDDPNLFTTLHNLGVSYRKRFDRTGNVDDLSLAISACQKSINLAQHDSGCNWGINVRKTLANLGELYAHQFILTGKLEDISLAISNLRKAVELTPTGYPDLPDLLTNLAVSFHCRFCQTGELKDLELAFSNLKEAVKTSSSEHPNQPLRSSILGDLYASRWEHMGDDLDDLALSIENTAKAIETARVDDPELATMFHNMGKSYSMRFKHTGNLEDLSLAISYQQRAVEATRPGDLNLSSRLSNLGTMYSNRFKRTGDLNELDLSISNLQKSVDSTPPRHLGRHGAYNNLGNRFCIRFDKTRDLKDLASAIYNHQKGMEIIGPDHPDFPKLLGNLAYNYARRFSVTKDVNDLALAISNERKALEFTSSKEVKVIILSNLSMHHLELFKRALNPDDLYLAISNQREAIDLTPPGHPNLPTFFGKLGSFLIMRFVLTNQEEDRSGGLSLLRQGASTNGAPSARFLSAKSAAEHAPVFEPSMCMDDCSTAMDLLSQLVGFDQIILHRHHHLRDASTFTNFAVAAALHFERIDLALRWLEQGRCLVWNQITQLRSSFDTLRNEQRELADELDEVARALDAAGSRPASLLTISDITIKDEILLQNEANRHSSLASRYDALLKSIREKDGFADFLLLRDSGPVVSSLPPDGPVVIINLASNPHLSRSDALIIERGKDTRVVPLRSITIPRVQTMAAKLHKRLRHGFCEEESDADADDERGTRPARQKKQTDLLVTLWEEVVEPIFKALGYLDSPVPLLEDRSRLWWCPTGPLMFLPLHAAHAAPISGEKTEPPRSVSDFVVSSYTPTIGALVTKYNAALAMTTKCTGVAVVSQPYAPSFQPIPGTIKEVETVNRILDCTSIPHDLLEDREATIGAVTEKMATCSWLHFACHGIQDEKDPLSSGLALQDGLLKLSDIVRERPPHTDFAFLSACQTGKGAADLSDEAVHISAGMLATGFNSVIGTMWSISDEHGPKFAEDVYKYLIRDAAITGKLDSSKAAHALDYATREFRERHEYGDVSSAWVPYVHFGY